MVISDQWNKIKLNNLLCSSNSCFVSLKYSSLALALLSSSCYVSAATYNVTSLADSGNGTLRDAILQGNDSTDSTIFIDLRSATGQLSLQSSLPMISNYAGSNNMSVGNKTWVFEATADNSFIIDGQNTYNGLFLSPLPEPDYLDTNTSRPKADIDTATYGKDYPYTLNVTLKNITIQNTTAQGGDTNTNGFTNYHNNIGSGGGGMLRGNAGEQEWNGGGGLGGITPYDSSFMGGAGFGNLLMNEPDTGGSEGSSWDPIAGGISQTNTLLPSLPSFQRGEVKSSPGIGNNSNGGIGGGGALTSFNSSSPISHNSNGGFGGGGGHSALGLTNTIANNISNGGFGGGASRTLVLSSSNSIIRNSSNGGFGGGGGNTIIQSGSATTTIENSSNGGFGGGGGNSSPLSSRRSNCSRGGFGGGDAHPSSNQAGGAAGLGGAIFANVGVKLTLENVILSGNNATGGFGNGGGGGLGGAVFIREGSQLNIKGALGINDNTVVGGLGTNPGSAFGSGIFLQGSSGTTNSTNAITSTLAFAPAIGETQILDDIIADQKGSVPTETQGWGVIKEGEGDLIVLDQQAYSGDTLISDGTLQIGNGTTGGNLQGNIINDAKLVFHNPNTTTYRGNISGPGDFTKRGTQPLLLTGNKTGPGITTIEEGTLQIGDGVTDGSIEGDIVNNTILAFHPTMAPMTYPGTITGPGIIRKEGPQDLILTGSIDGNPITINDGNLQIGNGGTLADINTNFTFNNTNAQLTFNHANNTDFSGDISGNTSLIKRGLGRLNLTNPLHYTGDTLIEAGELRVNTTLTSNAIVSNGATLSGNAIVQDLINNGVVAPGNPGTTLQANSFSNSNGIYKVEVNTTGQSTQLQVTDIANLGGTLNVIPLAGNYQKGQFYTYTILTAQNGFNDTTFTTISPSPLYSYALTYNTTNLPPSVTLTLTKKSLLTTLTQVGNGNAIAHNLDSLSSPTGSLKNAITQLTQIEEATTFNQAVNQLGNASNGSLNQELAHTFFDSGDTVFTSMHPPLSEERSAKGKFAALVSRVTSPITTTMAQLFRPFTKNQTTSLLSQSKSFNNLAPLSLQTRIGQSSLWLSSSIKSVHHDCYSSYGNFIPKLSLTGAGTQVGGDHRFGKNILLGLTASYFHTSYHLGQSQGQGRINTYQMGLYGSVNLTPQWYINFLGSYAYNRFNGTRSINFSNFEARSSHQHYSNQWGSMTETGYKIALPYNIALTPLVNLGILYSDESKYREQGGGTVGLDVKSQSRTFLNTKVGVQLDKHFKTNEMQFYTFAKLAYSQQRGLNHSHKTTASFIGQMTTFVVSSNKKPEKLVSPSVGLTALWANNLQTTIGYKGDFSKDRQAHAGFLQIGKSF